MPLQVLLQRLETRLPTAAAAAFRDDKKKSQKSWLLKLAQIGHQRTFGCRKRVLACNGLVLILVCLNVSHIYRLTSAPAAPVVAQRSRQEMEGRRPLSMKEDLHPADPETTTSGPPSNLATFEREMVARRSRVESVCQSAGTTAAAAVNYRELFLQREWNLMWCPVYKATTTTWLTYLVQLSPRTPLEKEHFRKMHMGRVNEVARDLYPRINTAQELDLFQREATGPVAKFMVVRHPFYRLVSAYRDKLERSLLLNPKSDYYYKLYGDKIFKRYRARALERFGADFFSARNNFGTPVAPRIKGRRSYINPTFWEFVQFVKEAKSPASLDIHWQPMSTFCSICSLDYDYILKFEQLEAEETMFLEARNLTATLERKWMNPNPPGQAKMDPDTLTKLYFEQLTDEDVLALYKIYELDFKLFDYSFSYRGNTFPL